MSIINAFLGKGYGGNRMKFVRADYDFAVQAGVQGTIALLGQTVIPSGAIIMGGFINITTAVTSAGAATIAVQIESAGDVVATTGKASWTTSPPIKNILPADTSGSITASTLIKTTAARDISIVIATADLTAGKFQVVINYCDPLS